MHKKDVKREVGKPKREIVDSLRGIIWFQRVSLLSSKNARQLEKEFSPESFIKNIDGIVNYSKQWGRYEVGKHLPRIALQKKVEVVYPGSLIWLSHPIWNLLRERPPCDEELKIMMSSIKPHMTKYIGKIPKWFGVKRLNYFLNMPKDDELINKGILLKKFTGLLVLAVDSENKGDKYLLRISLKYAVLLLPFIVDMFFDCIRDDIYDVFLNRFALNDEYIGSVLSVLRNETPFFNISLDKKTVYPPKDIDLIPFNIDTLF